MWAVHVVFPLPSSTKESESRWASGLPGCLGPAHLSTWAPTTRRAPEHPGKTVWAAWGTWAPHI